MEIPKLGNNKAIVLRAQYGTGKILNNDDTFYNSEGGDYYKVMESIDKAIIYAKEEVKKGLVEVLIYNDKGDFEAIFKPEIEKPKVKEKPELTFFYKLVKKLKYKNDN